MNHAATRLALAAFAATATVAAAALITGCSASPSQPAASASSVSSSPAAAPSSVPASSPAATPSAVATPTPAPTATATTPPPTLGQLAGVFVHGQGFGQVAPSTIFNGGDPTGLVKHIKWQSWGAPEAIGSGRAEYVGPNQSVATGTIKAATVVAFNLGTCDGKLMYQAVEWYFPAEGQSFNAKQYENVCTGSYVPAS